MRRIIAAAAVAALAGGVAVAQRRYVERPPTARHESSSSGTAAAIYTDSSHGPVRAGLAGPGDSAYASARPDAAGTIVQGSRLRGRITDLDRSDGTVKVELSNGEEVSLVFPQSALAAFREGDVVTLSANVGMAESEQPATGVPPGGDVDD